MTGRKRVAAIVVAAGRGERAAMAGSELPKQYRPIAGVPMLQRTIAALLKIDAVDLVLPVIHPEHDGGYAALRLSDPKLLPAVAGGATRQSSVLAGLKALGGIAPDLVLIQDAARPFVDTALVDGVLAALTTFDGALPAIPVIDTVKRSNDGRSVDATEDRKTLFAAQTPQGFRYAEILAAHVKASALPQEFTDDASIAEWAGLSVALSPGSSRNIKITLPEDFARAERLLRGDRLMETRVGTGFDVHPFELGDFVTLGGIKIAHTQRLQGHSDADVALHALTDAIYGALGEGDIGTHFPPSDPQWRGADSAIFLKHAVGLVAARGGRILNLDLTIVCEAPRIGPHVAAMRERIGQICTISPSRVAVKATTSERLGFTGRGEGIVALATASVEVPGED
ncbi:MAG: bifunctional 2-C-methyl-D-erythritol 4-phosphate cytidylyltransferase/2-C-methyl-D-erythritol 2,4-cyclodiphosphate synthase [Devosia sp.]